MKSTVRDPARLIPVFTTRGAIGPNHYISVTLVIFKIERPSFFLNLLIFGCRIHLWCCKYATSDVKYYMTSCTIFQQLTTWSTHCHHALRESNSEFDIRDRYSDKIESVACDTFSSEFGHQGRHIVVSFNINNLANFEDRRFIFFFKSTNFGV